MLNNHEIHNDGDKNSRGSFSSPPVYVEIKHCEKDNNSINHQAQPLKVVNTNESQMTNSYLPRNSANALDREDTRMLNVQGAAAAAAPSPGAFPQLNVENGSTNGQSSQVAGGSGSYVDPAILSLRRD